MPRPSKWKSKTTAIRVPEHAADHLLEIARQLDAPSSFVQNLQPTLITIEDYATTERYILQNEPLSADEEAIVESAMSELWAQCETLSPNEKWLLLADLVQATLKPLSIEKHV